MSHPSLIPVVNRLGVTLGVGDATIGAMCQERGIDTDFFLSVVNTFLDERYFPANALGTFTLEKTIDYLKKTGDYYLHAQLPNIERHLGSLIARSGNDNNLELLEGFFRDVRSQLQECMRADSETLYPALLKGEVPDDGDRIVESHTEVEEKLHDLLYFFVVHLHGKYDSNLCVAVVTAVSSLEKDIRQNNRIRQRILIPLMHGLREEKC